MWPAGNWSTRLEAPKSCRKTRIFLVALLSALGTAALLSQMAVRIGNFTLPSVHIGWLIGSVILLLFLAVPRSPVTARPLVCLLAGLGLAAVGWLLVEWWQENRTPASPLSVRLSQPSASEDSDDGALFVSEGIDPLHLSERRYLARLTGYRRNVALDIGGFLFAPTSGGYRFELRCDDRCELWIGGQSVGAASGSGVASLTLAEGVHSFRLHYRQGAGPAALVMEWDRPEPVELLPFAAFVAGDSGALENARLRSERHSAQWMLVLWVGWMSALAYVVVRVAESRIDWAWGFFSRIRDWWRRPQSSVPTILVRPRAWLAAGSGLLVLWRICAWRTPAWLEGARQEYAVNPVRQPFVLERIAAFPSYLLFLVLLCLLVAAALRLARAGSPSSASSSRPPRSARSALFVAIGIAAVWGVRVSQSEWVRYDRPCYDGYCDYAELVRQVLIAPGRSSWEVLRRHLDHDYHANSPLGPILIASLGLVIPDIVVAYRLLSALATLATLVLLLRIARRYLGLSPTSAWIAAFLFVASGSVARSSFFPQTDALAMFFFTLSVERLLALDQSFTLARYGLATACLTVSLFTKLSTLPLIGVAAMVPLWPVPESTPRASPDSRDTRNGSGAPLAAPFLLRSLRAAAVVVPPLVLVGLFLVAFRTLDNYRTELHRIATLDSRSSFHIVATLVTLFPLLLAVLLTGRRTWTRLETLLLAVIGVYLFGLWGSGASGWERFYLNVMPLALPLSVKRLEPLPEMNASVKVSILCSAYFVAHAARILLHLYSGA